MPKPRRSIPPTPGIDPGAHDLRAAIAHPGLRDLPPTPDRLASADVRWNALRDVEGPVPPTPTWQPDATPADDRPAPTGRLAALLEAWEHRAPPPPTMTCDVCGAPYTEGPSGRLEIVHRLERHEHVRAQTPAAAGPVRVHRVGSDDEDRTPVRRPAPAPSALARLSRTMGNRDDD